MFSMNHLIKTGLILFQFLIILKQSEAVKPQSDSKPNRQNINQSNKNNESHQTRKSKFNLKESKFYFLLLHFSMAKKTKIKTQFI